MAGTTGRMQASCTADQQGEAEVGAKCSITPDDTRRMGWEGGEVQQRQSGGSSEREARLKLAMAEHETPGGTRSGAAAIVQLARSEAGTEAELSSMEEGLLAGWLAECVIVWMMQ